MAAKRIGIVLLLLSLLVVLSANRRAIKSTCLVTDFLVEDNSCTSVLLTSGGDQLLAQ